MRYRISFGVPPGTERAIAQLLTQGVEVEAHLYAISEGTLTLYSDATDIPDSTVIVYAAGVWRSICAVGAYTEATKPLEEPPRENPRRR